MTISETAKALGTDEESVRALIARGTLPRVDEEYLCCRQRVPLAVDVASIREVMTRKLGAGRSDGTVVLCPKCKDSPKIRKFGRPKAVEMPWILTSTSPRFLRWAQNRELTVKVDGRHFLTERGQRLRAFLLETQP